MKILTFNIMCSLLFGLERGTRRDKLVEGFEQMMEGIWAVPVNLPFTRYHRSLKASKKVRDTVKELIREKRSELKGKSVTDPRQDLIACLLSIRNEEGKEALTEKEIVDNIMLVMIAGHETSSILITFVLRFLANEPSVHAAVLQGKLNRFDLLNSCPERARS